MEEQVEERPRKVSILPPDYVSLAMLRERWLLKKQQEKELEEKQKELEAKQNADVKNQETDETVETQQIGVENKEKKKRKWNKRNKNKKKQIGEFSREIDKNNVVVSSGSKVNRAKVVDDETKANNNGYNTWRNRKRFGGNRFGNGEKVDESGKGFEKSKALEEIGESEVCYRVEGVEVEESDGFKRKDDSFVGIGLKDAEKVEPRSQAGGRGPWWSGNEGRNIGRGRRKSGKRKGGGSSGLGRSGKGDEKAKDSDEMSKSEVLEVGLKLEGLKVMDGNGRKDDRVVGVGLSDDQIAGNGSRAKNGENGRAGNGAGKNKNGNTERRSGRPAFGNRRQGSKMAGVGNRSGKSVAEHGESSKSHEKVQGLDGMSKSEGYGRAGYVGNRNYAGSGRFGGGRMDRRDSGMVWVKKGEKSTANAAQVGFTGN